MRHGSPHKFEATEESLEHLEGKERREAIPPMTIVSRMSISPRDSVLDLGSGIGYFTFPMAERAAEVSAMDIEPKMLSVLASRLRERAVENVRLVKGDINSLPFGSASVDHVLAAFVYHEVADQFVLIKECARVLRPMGFLTVVDFQKRLTSEMGPPIWVRKKPEHVLKTAAPWFSKFARFESETYYQLIFRKV